jgi:alpha-mannosidase
VDAAFVIEGRDDIDMLTARHVEVVNAQGDEMEVYDANAVKNYSDHSVIVKFKCDGLPSIGYKTYYIKIADCCEKEADNKLCVTELCSNLQEESIENEFYRIDIKGNEILGIFDKSLNEFVSGKFANDLTIEDDIGSPWETLMQPLFTPQRLTAPYSLEELLPPDYSVSSYIKRTKNASVFVREGRYSNIPKNTRKLIWKQETTLYNGVNRVDFKTEIDWDSERSRLRVKFPLNFKPENDAGYYEIPYGTLERKAYKPTTGGYTCSNGDWPALNFVACHDKAKNCTVAVINKGIPSYCIRDGVIMLTVLRSPREFFCAFNIEGATDAGKHLFEYSLVSGKGDLKANDIVSKARLFNTVFMNCAANAKTAELPQEYSFLANTDNGVLISAVKRVEGSDGIIMRAYEAYGQNITDSVKVYGDDYVVTECNLLEQNTSVKPEKKIIYTPFEIKTIKIKQ